MWASGLWAAVGVAVSEVHPGAFRASDLMIQLSNFLRLGLHGVHTTGIARSNSCAVRLESLNLPTGKGLPIPKKRSISSEL